MKFNAFSYLLGNAFLRLAVRWVESFVIAIGATAGAFCAIAVGAGKAGIEGYFLNPGAKLTPEIFGIRIISPVVSPGINIICHGTKVTKKGCLQVLRIPVNALISPHPPSAPSPQGEGRKPPNYGFV